MDSLDTTLGSFAVNAVSGQYYSIRLDATGNPLRACLDHRLLFEAADDVHARGSTGLTTYEAYAECDSFVAHKP